MVNVRQFQHIFEQIYVTRQLPALTTLTVSPGACWPILVSGTGGGWGSVIERGNKRQG